MSKPRPDVHERMRALRRWLQAWLREAGAQVDPVSSYTWKVNGVTVQVDIDYDLTPSPMRRVTLRLSVDCGGERRWEERRGKDIDPAPVAEWLLREVGEAKPKVEERERARAAQEERGRRWREFRAELGAETTTAEWGRGQVGLGMNRDDSWTLYVGGLLDDEVRDLVDFLKGTGLLRPLPAPAPEKPEGEEVSDGR